MPARVRLRNLKRITPSFSIELSAKADPINNTPPILTSPIYFPLLTGGSETEAAVDVATFPLRGRHQKSLCPLDRFPFGFLHKRTNVPLRRETIVYPRLEPTEDAELLLHDITGELGDPVRGSGREFHRIRPYEPRDSARHVDWKTTAHTGELQVREFARENQRAVEVYLVAAFLPATSNGLKGRSNNARFWSRVFPRPIPDSGSGPSVFSGHSGSGRRSCGATFSCAG